MPVDRSLPNDTTDRTASRLSAVPATRDRRAVERMAPLAKLPVFWSLEGKPVLVAGGSDGAAWKAELLAACGAEVHVWCPQAELGETFRKLMAERGEEGTAVPGAGSPPSVLRDISSTRGEIDQAEADRSVTDAEDSATFPSAASASGAKGLIPFLSAVNTSAPDGLVARNRSAGPEPISPLVGEMPGRAEGGGSALSQAIEPGTIRHHDAAWSAKSLANMSLALADCETEEEAGEFYRAAVAAGVPVNVIDKPAFCQFQFGSIVNRSPVIVSISTDGAAPILGQAIRRRIETLLPPALKGWAELAQSVRERVNTLLAPGNERRSFWESFVDHAFAGSRSPAADMGARLLADASRIATAPASGRVTLVGAGPGDAELLTLKAVRALQAADVILFDDLVSAEVLELARREARRMLVGKRGGRTSCRQEDINDMMVNFAKAGKRVVRLKSGDPMIFGRAGEEIARLEAEGIPVEVVPGITAASAMASRLGLSLTHRDHAQSVRFVTGHSRHGDLPANIDWNALSDPTVTTVFYMGGRTAAKIEAALIAAGMPAATPVVIMTSVTRDNETRWAGTLAELGDAVSVIGVDQPILIAVGNAFEKAVIAPRDQSNPLRLAETMSLPA